MNIRASEPSFVPLALGSPPPRCWSWAQGSLRLGGTPGASGASSPFPDPGWHVPSWADLTLLPPMFSYPTLIFGKFGSLQVPALFQSCL